MSQKIEILNTKQDHPQWDLGKDFFSSLYRKIKDQNPSISKDFTKTFLKLPREGLETTWRQCWPSGLKTVLRKLLSIAYCRLMASFSVCWLSFCKGSDWDWMKYTFFERFLFVLSLFICFCFCCCCCFESLENYVGFRATNVRVKTDNSVSLKWNKTFWTFSKRFVFFW